jgi:hypothetical protein
MAAVIPFFEQMLTGKDNQTADVARVLGVVVVLTALGLEIYSVIVRGAAFDLTAFGVGMGGLLVSVGAFIRLKSNTEPEPKA